MWKYPFVKTAAGRSAPVQFRSYIKPGPPLTFKFSGVRFNVYKFAHYRRIIQALFHANCLLPQPAVEINKMNAPVVVSEFKRTNGTVNCIWLHVY